jgi:hydrogenase maturation protease
MDMVVIGVGAGWHGVGPLVVDLLRHMNVPDVRLAESDGDPAELVALWDKADLAIVVEPVAATGDPGRIRPMGLPGPQVGGDADAVTAAVTLGRSLGRMPEQLVRYGIETGPDRAAPLAPPVREACQRLATQISALVAAPR